MVTPSKNVLQYCDIHYLWLGKVKTTSQSYHLWANTWHLHKGNHCDLNIMVAG
jgi:hypothetical protein